MQSGKLWLPRIMIYAVAILILSHVTVFAQEPITSAVLDEWFRSRLIWGLIVGLILGSFIGLVHLCRLQFRFDWLSLNHQARRKFGVWIILLLVSGIILLFLDTWLLYQFRLDVSMTFSEALTQVLLNYRTLLILGATLGAFTLAVAISTRLKSDCHCRYAFLPGPRGK